MFSQIESITALTLSGGEPSLVPEKIQEILESAKRFNVSIGNFYLVTNGMNVSKEFLHAIIDIYVYCDDNEISGVKLSKDAWHPIVSHENIKALQTFSFFELGTYDNRWSRSYLVNEGRAKKLGARKEVRVFNPYIKEWRQVEGNLYLNCKGNVIKSCDLSYRSQDKPANILCRACDNLRDFIMVQTI